MRRARGILRRSRPFVRRDIAAIEARGDFLIHRAIGQQIAGELLDRELIERLVAIEGRDHPIAKRPNFAIIVEMNAVGIGVARGIEPIAGPMLAIAGRRQQAIDVFFIRIGRFVVQKLVELAPASAAGRSDRGTPGGPTCGDRPPGPAASRSARASPERTDRSGSCTQAAFFTAGNSGRFGAMNDHSG